MKNKYTIFLSLALLVSLLFPNISFSGGGDKDRTLAELPKLLGISNAGTEFYLSFHPGYKNKDNDNKLNAVRIFFASEYSTNVYLSVPGKSFSEEELNIDPNTVYEFVLTPDIALCDDKMNDEQPRSAFLFEKYGIHITADDPVIVYGVLDYKDVSEGFLAIPVARLGMDYVVAAGPDPSKTESGLSMPSYTSIVAAFDGTVVNIESTTNTNIDSLSKGDDAEFQLNEGDVLQISSKGYSGDLSGSIISANKPVSVLSGNYCAETPLGLNYCNYTIEMELPSYVWGKEYHIAPINGRKNSSYVRILASDYNTKVYRDGEYIGVVSPTNDLFIRANSEGAAPVVLTADKPIYVVQYNPGYEDDEIASAPFQMIVAPKEQYLEEIIFCAPSTRAFKRFDDNVINIIYESDSNGNIPSSLEITENDQGSFIWKSLSEIDSDPGLEIKDGHYMAKQLQLPMSGVYKLRASSPMAAYNYGFDEAGSYGFPASMGLLDISVDDSIPPDVTWDMDCSGNVEGIVKDMPDDPDRRSNLSPNVFDKKNSKNYSFHCERFEPGVTRETNWTLTVDNPLEKAWAIIDFFDRSGNSKRVEIEYFPTELTIDQSVIDYKKIKIDRIVGSEIWLKNESDSKTVTIESAVLKFNDKGYVVTPEKALPFELAPGDSLKLIISFTSDKEGVFEDIIVVNDKCLDREMCLLKAEVLIPDINVDNSIEFGDVSDGASSMIKGEINNGSDIELEVSSAKLKKDDGSFKVYKDDKGNLFNDTYNKDNPLIIPARGKADFYVKFIPKGEDDFSDMLEFVSDAQDGNNTCELTGRGIKSGFVASSFDWNKVRILDATDNPYIYTIKFENTGSQQATIANYTIEGDKNAFTIDPNIVRKVIAPGSSEDIEVSFKPTAIGEYQVEITYQIEEDSREVVTILNGIGVVPRININESDLIFEGVVGDKENPDIKTILITSEDFPYADSLTITDIVSEPAGAVSSNPNVFGNRGFRINKVINFPVMLLPGEKIEVPIAFAAVSESSAGAELKTVSDAEADKSVNLSGTGIVEKITLELTKKEICLGESDIMICKVSNLGIKDIVLDDCMFSPVLPEMQILPSKEEVFPLTVAAGDFEEFEIEFKPERKGDYATKLFIYAGGEEALDSIEILQSASQFRVATYISPESQQIEIGTMGNIDLKFDNKDNDISLADVREFEVRVTYDHDFMLIKPNNIEVGEALQGVFEIPYSSISIKDGELSFMMKQVADDDDLILKNSGVLAKINFNVYLPTTESLTSTISHEIIFPNPLALEVEETDAELSILPICKFEIRRVNVSDYRYRLYPTKPNPVSGDKADIKFTVALDGEANLSLYNSNGEVIYEIYSGSINAGEYIIELPLNELASGVYWYRMSSGPYTKTEKLIISK